MEPEKTTNPDLVLDLASFQLIRSGRRVKLEKTPMELLTLLVRKRAALVTRDEIVRSLWGDAVHVDVEAGINTAIRKIRQALEDDAAQPRYLETVVGKGYRFVGPIHVVDGNVTATETAARTSAPRGPRIWVPLGAAGLAVVLLGAWYAIHRGVRASSPEMRGRLVIAVIPLKNLSGDPAEDYFVDGLTEEVITQLGQLNPDRIGVLRYDAHLPAPQDKSFSARPSEQSGWQYLLEGSVRRQGAHARISLQLVRVADQTAVWTESFDRDVGDVLSLQSEIAERIGHELQIRMLGHAGQEPANPEVVEAYLRGRFELSRHTIPVPDAARANFEHAIALDSSYAPAHAGLADFYRSRAVSNDEGAAEDWPLAEQHANQALSLDPQNAEAHAALAQIKLMHAWDWPAARGHALRALQLNPSSPEAHGIYARYLRVAGKMSEAVNQRKQAAALDPSRADLLEQLLLEYFLARDYQSEVELARRMVANEPQNKAGHEALCAALGHLEQFNQAAEECIKTLALEGRADWAHAYLREYHEHGYRAADLLIARKQLQELLKRPKTDLWDLANAYTGVGMGDRALGTLFEGVPIHEPGLLQVRVDPDFDAIRGDPRYAELVRQIGFPAE